jgi:LCP family protein required for cell wall assembly
MQPVSRPVIRLDRALHREAMGPAEPAPVAQPVAPDAVPVSSAQKRVSDSRPQLRRRLDMELPGDQPGAFRHPVFRRRLGVLRHWAFRATAGAAILILLTGGLLFTQGFFSAQKVFKGGAHAAALQAHVDPNLLKGEGDGRVNILLLGNGGPNHDGADLTDTMMVASIDPINHKAVLISIPRDLWVKVPGHGSMKINAAYAMGKYDFIGKIDTTNNNTNAVLAGFKTADQVVESTLGIPIHYNLLVNFPAFKKGVDAVGGVTINVPELLYDRSMAWENHNNPILAKPGVQHFNGQKALLYVRSRHTSSDFARAERQRAVIEALKEKIVSIGTLSNPLKLSQLMSAFGNNVVTDLSLTDAGRLYQLVKLIPGGEVKSLGFTDPGHMLVRTGRVGNQSVVLPLAGMNNYDPIRLFVRKALPDGFIVKENAPVTVLNGTKVAGLATKESKDLKTYGYNVINVANAPVKNFTTTTLVDLSGGKDKYTKHYLEQRFGLKAVSQLPDTIQNDGSHFILILGSDETSSQ